MCLPCLLFLGAERNAFLHQKEKRASEELNKLLNDVETHLNKTKYRTGEELSSAGSMFVHILAHITSFDLGEKYISCRPRISGHFTLVKQLPSYKVAIGKYVNIWDKYRTLFKTLFLKYGWLLHS
ncbi:hypothetical protein SETIT_7G103000v2 [Setaria italica]|uniref:Uncharacterized protein n=1 Tax=Setaria italica TaxID=4555 RepID=A0A368RU56_SETIT|nr:hypothetical protein SETIT_7G103000v2 [Setaria italica]